MADLKKSSLDIKKAKEGVWIDFDGETRFLIGSINSREYEKELMNQYKAYRHPAKQHLLDDPDIILKHRIKAMAKCVLLGWDNFTNDGQPFPYSVENAELVLKQSPELRSFVEDEAKKSSTFNLAVEEAANENLKSVPDVAV